MRIGLYAVVLMIFGCTGTPTATTNKPAEISRQDPCVPYHQQAGQDDRLGPSCQAHHVWWNNVGDALSGVATAVRLPRP